MNHNIHICYCVDKTYWILFLISLHSLIATKQSNTTINVYVFLQQFQEFEIQYIKKFFLIDIFIKNDVHINVINANFCQYKTHKNNIFPDSVFLRLIIPQALTDIDRVLYIDCDTIIQKDLTDLFNYGIDDNIFGAVYDFGIALNKKHIENGCTDANVCWLKKLNYIYDYNEPYFNSGILIYNLKKIRNIKFDEICQACYDKNLKTFAFPDQDLINFAFKGQIQPLPVEFNNQFSIFNDNNALHLYNIDAFNWTFNTNYKLLKSFIDYSYIIHYSMNKDMMFSDTKRYMFFKEFIFQKLFDMLYYFDMLEIILNNNYCNSFSNLMKQFSEKIILKIIQGLK